MRRLCFAALIAASMSSGCSPDESSAGAGESGDTGRTTLATTGGASAATASSGSTGGAGATSGSTGGSATGSSASTGGGASGGSASGTAGPTGTTGAVADGGRSSGGSTADASVARDGAAGTTGASTGDSSVTRDATRSFDGATSRDATSGLESGLSVDAVSSGTTGGASDASVTSCLGSDMLAQLGKNHLLVGASMADGTAAAAPFDLRYIYISGQIPDQAGPCGSCLDNCTTTDPNGVVSLCDNAHGCGWWGCWQYDMDPPGEYVPSFIASAEQNGQIAMFTYYVLLQSYMPTLKSLGLTEGPDEVRATNDGPFIARYFDNFRFFLQKIGNKQVIVHIEPDFWGYGEQLNEDPHQTPAKVTTTNPTDCASLEDSLAGFGQCLIAMTRKYAPNAKVGLHASGWGTKIDVLDNASATLDVAAEGRKLARFLLGVGAGGGDFVAADPLDRDADYYRLVLGQNRWWDDTNTTLPDFHQAFTWAAAVAETVGKGILWWQIPVGNAAQNDTTNHYKDNRVDYLLTHMDEVARAHGVGLAFGAGDGQQTTPETDGGNLVSKVQAYSQSGGQPLCVP